MLLNSAPLKKIIFLRPCSNGDLLNVVEIANEFIWSLNIGSEGLEDFNRIMTKIMKTTFLQVSVVGFVFSYVIFNLFINENSLCS